MSLGSSGSQNINFTIKTLDDEQLAAFIERNSEAIKRALDVGGVAGLDADVKLHVEQLRERLHPAEKLGVCMLRDAGGLKDGDQCSFSRGPVACLLCGEVDDL